MTLYMLVPVICCQVYLMVGGYADIASTELLIDVGLDHEWASPPSSLGTASGLNHCQ